MSAQDILHELGYSEIVVLIQDGVPRQMGNRFSEDKTHYVFATLDKDGNAIRLTCFHRYSPADGESVVESVKTPMDPQEHARLVIERGTMENPKPFDPNGKHWCLKCGGKMRTYENKGGTVRVCRSCGNRIR